MASITNCKVCINCSNDHNCIICKVDVTCSECSHLSGALCEKCETNYNIKGNDEVTLQINNTKLLNTLKINEIVMITMNHCFIHVSKYLHG